MPHLALRGTRRYLFTTDQQFLDPSGYLSQTLRRNIARDAQMLDAEPLNCLDERHGLVLAAVAFHVDERMSVPIILTDIGVRRDELHALNPFGLSTLSDVLLQVAETAPRRADDRIVR
jgi:hypothetical protein